MRKNKIDMTKGLRTLCAAVLAASVLCACGNKNAATKPAEDVAPVQTTLATEVVLPEAVLAVESVTEQGDMVIVQTTYCDVKYPFAFADLIGVEAEEEKLNFVLQLSGEEHLLFAICFQEGEGIPLGTLAVEGKEEPVAVWAQIGTADEAALGDNVSTYYAAQESFNDVLASLMENEGFTAAQ